MVRKTLLITFFMFAIGIAISGCYTIIKHPQFEETQEYSHTDLYQTCIDCHEDYSEYPYGWYYEPLPDYYWQNEDWGHYHIYPWWWEKYWWGDNKYTEGDTQYKYDNDTPPEERRGLIPPYSDPDEPIYVPPPLQLPTGGSGGVSAGDSDPNNNNDDDNSGNKEKPEQKSEPVKPPKRRLP